jgi:hypothetical protein
MLKSGVITCLRHLIAKIGVNECNGDITPKTACFRSAQISWIEGLAAKSGIQGQVFSFRQAANSHLTQATNKHLTTSRQLRRIRIRLTRLQHYIRPKAAFVGELLLWRKAMWMRSCAICKALLKKLRSSDFVRCHCGWEWQGHADSKMDATS